MKPKELWAQARSTIERTVIPPGWLSAALLDFAEQQPRTLMYPDSVGAFVVKRSVMYESGSIFGNEEFQRALSIEDRAELISSPGVSELDQPEGAAILGIYEDLPSLKVLDMMRCICARLPDKLYGHTTRVDVFGPKTGPGARFVGFHLDAAGHRRVRNDRKELISGQHKSIRTRNSSSHVSFLKTFDKDTADELAEFYQSLVSEDAPIVFSQATVMSNRGQSKLVF